MDEFNILDEITKRIQEEEDNAIAKAFTMYIGDLLIRNGIKPITTKVEIPYEECLNKNEYQIVSRYGYMFERLDTSEHDRKIRDEVIDELITNALDCDNCYVSIYQLKEIGRKLKGEQNEM